ncbi:hypothetical protein H2200_004145 [Cladophialophora chaetospira]|uniref:Major facilitator superfamily (MFS) profile domain-containing protein n=1 Tax=Cladophialophora chaetospira TaxID=386627 RepID=A0AA38XFK0_9EURO|nr:hypothetical protein H2200_004145 [Cladophialophora chaetospira]
MSSIAPEKERENRHTWLDGVLHSISNPTRSLRSIRDRSRSGRGPEVTAGQEIQTPSCIHNSTENISLTTTARNSSHDLQSELSTKPLPLPPSTSVADGQASEYDRSPDPPLESSVSQPLPDSSQEDRRRIRSSTSISDDSGSRLSVRSAVSSLNTAHFLDSHTHLHLTEEPQDDEISVAPRERSEVLPSRSPDPRNDPSKRLSTFSAFSAFSARTTFSGFEIQPAIYPIERRKTQGETAGQADEDGEAEDEDNNEYPGPLPLSLVVLGICLAVFIVSLDRSIITTVNQAIPKITARFHSYDNIGWYGSAYLLTASAFQPLYGRIYTTFESKSCFLVALSIFEAGSLLGALSPTSKTLILARGIQGLGSAGLITGAFVIGTHSVRLQHRPILFAGVGMLYGIGALCGPLLGGAFTDTIGWRWCFWINLPAGAVTYLTVFFCFKNGSNVKLEGMGTPFIRRVLQLDMIGNVIVMGAMTMLNQALQLSQERLSWSNPPVIGLLCGFGVTSIVFVVWIHYRGDSALIPPRIIKQTIVASSCGTAFFIYGALLIHSYYLPIWFQAIKGASAIHSGVNMIPYMCMNAIFCLIAGIFVSKNGLFAYPSILGCAIGTIGSGFLATVKPNTPLVLWVVYEIIISMGLGMAIQQGFTAVQATLPLKEIPIGTAAVVASQSLGGAIFVSIGNTLLQNHLLNVNNAKSIPGVNVRAVIELGATSFRNVVPKNKLPALIQLYNDSLQAVFIAAVPLCGVAFLCSLCMLWKSKKRSDWQTEVKGEGEAEDAKA